MGLGVGDLMRWPALLLSATFLGTGCEPVVPDPPPRLFAGPDASSAEVSQIDPTAPGRCLPEGADTIVVGPLPGCVRAEIDPAPFQLGEAGHPIFAAHGRPLRVVNLGEDLVVDLYFSSACDPERVREELRGWQVFHYHEDCRAELTGGACEPSGGRSMPRPHDAWAYDGRTSEHRLAGHDDVTLIVEACAHAP